MKTKKKLFVVIVAFSVIATFVVGVFHLNAQTVPMIEKRIGNTVYELDTARYILKNKTNKITHEEYSYGGCVVAFDNDKQAHEDWLENFKPVFSKERAEELNVRIRITCIFDLIGQIQEIEIFFRNREDFEMFTLSEIKTIEDAIKKHQYRNLSWHNCGNLKYGYFSHPLNPYLLYFEKSK